jgi:pimeloyl-ACP methyl ester carboxylesterase
MVLLSCTTPPDIPRWFDAIHRMPVKTTLVQGHRIAYLDIGDGPPVVLIHGFGGSLWQWEYQQGPLAATHRVITLDLLGSGFSDKPDVAYTPLFLVESFREFMDALQIPRAALVGNSMGAGVVIGMALTYPERVDRIVLISGLPDHIRDKMTSPLMRRAIETRAPAWVVNLANWAWGRRVTSTVLSEIVHDQSLLTPAVIERSDRNRRRPGLFAPVLSLARNLPQWEDGFAKRLGDIRQSALILWGEQDKVFPSQVGRELQTVLPAATLELIPQAGHIPMWERPDAVNRLLLQFLQP